MASIKTYNITDDKRVVNKTLQGQQAFTNAQILQPSSYFTPTFIIKFVNKTFSLINYIYCAEFNRYYFVVDTIVKSGGIVEFHCKVDVLYTYRTYIKNLQNVHIIRQENVGMNLVNDNNIPLSPQIKIKIAQIENDILMSDTADNEDYCYLLTVAGRNN